MMILGMLRSLTEWLKHHKLAVFLLIILAWFVYKSVSGKLGYGNSVSIGSADYAPSAGISNPVGMSKMALINRNLPLPESSAPPTQGTNRLVIHNTNLSLLVKNVAQTIQAVEQAAVLAGGYLVSSELNVPEQAATGTIVIRVPESKRPETIAAIKNLGVKTVSESVTGEDVTDEYVDINARLETLTKTKAKFETILDQASSVQDTLEVQREIINLQSQIDALKGQQKYLEQSADLAKITVYLSTDELALPYAPSQAWRPQVIFRTAVRSLIGSFRQIGTLLIWLLVFAVIWLPILLIYLWYHHRQSKNSVKPSQSK